MQYQNRPLGSCEYIVRHDGVYTFAHFYKDPETKRRVVLVGMVHFADPAFYEQVKNILGPCDLVLHEDITPDYIKMQEVDSKTKFIQYVHDNIFSDDLDNSFGFISSSSSYLYYLAGFPYEGHVFENEYQQPWWVNTDLLRDHIDDFARYYEINTVLEEIRQQISIQHKQQCVRKAQRAMELIDDGRLNMHQLSQSDLGLLQIVSETSLSIALTNDILVTSRDAFLFNEFDALLPVRDPGLVGLKWGAGHMTSQRAMIEIRGYAYEYSMPLRSDVFKKSTK